MRKHVLLLVSVAMMLLTSMFSTAQTVYFTDGFEEGLNAGWTQEYYDVVSGNWVTETPDLSQPWKAESAANGDDLAYPNGAAVGKGRAYFRQEAAPGKNIQTTGYRTRLITPAMNLSGYQPILRFYHAQAKWTADFDTLRVYYRYGSEDWELLSEYTSPIQKWKFEELDLPHTGENYQLAFEADENMGRGIVLDSVIVRTKPQITTPHDLGYYDMRDNGINLTWEASKDADYFRVIVAEMDLDLNVIPSNIDSTQYIVVDTIIDSDLAQDIRVNDLASGRTYYVLAQSIGEYENSAWSETFSYRMKPVVNITATEGYFEDFTIPYKSNAVKDMQKETWTWGGDQPIIPMWVGEENFYMYSPDASCAVVFTGENKSSSGELTYSVPRGQVQYIVSPEISGKDLPGFSMSMCHVTFWGTTYKYQHNRAKAIIVGIATDPEDPTTFVPVDTCEVWGYMQFTYFDVDLSSYTGNGRYVVFATNFQDKDNWFALDKVTIELKPAISPVKASDISVIPTTTEVHMTWPAVEGAVKYKVKLKAMERKGAKVPLYESLMAGAYTYETTTNEFIYNDLTARTKYTYCVQAVGTDTVSAWSQPREFYTSAEMSVPKTYEFEELEGTYSREGEAASELFPRDWCIFTNDADAPYLYTSYYRNGSRCLYLVKDQYNDAWTVAPMIENLQEVEIVLYARLSSTSYPNSNVIVGVMEDPSDLKTFTPVATFTPASTNYERFYANFTNYKGTGKYIALLWGESGVTKNGLCIDDLSIRPLASCFAPTIEAQVTDSSAILRWTRKDETDRYTIKVCRVQLSETQILTAAGDTIVAEYEDYNEDTLQLNGLQFSTQYYVYAQTVCSETDQSDWVSMSFKTDCPEKMSLPYKNDFESENYSGSNSIPACWLKPTWTTTSSVYPYLSSSYNHTSDQSGNCLCMTSSTTYGSTIALPKIDADLENVKLRFWLYYSSAGYKTFAGLMSDPSDPTDFYPVDTFETVASTWVLCEAMFTAEDLKHGSYLAISSYTGVSNYGYIDDIEVINVIDAAPFNYKKVDAGTNWFEVKWDGKTSDKWKVIISDKSYALEGDFDPEDMIPTDSRIADVQVTNNGYKVEDGLQSLTWYYIYAKSSVGSEWSMDSIQTECTVWNPRIKTVQGFEVDAAGNTIRSTTSSMSTTTTYVNYFKNAKVPECWTVGNAKYGADPSQRNSSGYIPYICTDGAAASATPTAYAEKSAVGNQFSSEGVNSLKVYSYYSSTATSNQAPAWAAMNKLDCSDEDLKSLILTFDYQMATTAAYAIVVGIMDDPTDLSTFTVLDSIPGSKGSGTGSHKHASYEISLEDYQGTGRYIAFRGRYGATTIFYLDNVSVNLASCPNPKPSMSQITDNSAVISSGLRVPNSWQYIVTDSMYQAANLDAGTMPAPEHIIEQGIVQPINDQEDAPKSKRISNLAPKTDYYVYAATLCENDEISAWKMVSFTTLCAPGDADTWVGNFENDTTVSGYTPECWTVGSLTPGAAATYIPYVVSTTRKAEMEDPATAKTYNATTGAVTGAKVLRLYAYSTTSVGAYAISPAIKPAAGKTIQNYQIVFKGYGTSAQSGTTTTTSYAHNLRVGMTTDPSDLSKMTILDTVFLPTEGKQAIVELDSYTGDGNYIVFLLEKEAPTYSQVYIYDIHLEPIPACKIPSGLKLDSTTDVSAAFYWKGNASKYNVALSKKLYTEAEKEAGYLTNDSVIAADGILFKTVTETAINFDGLTPNTGYYAYVQGICGESDTTVWAYGALQFKTECIAEQPIPLKENFESYATSVTAPDCWEWADYGGTGYPKVMNPTSGAVSGHQYELWSTGTTHRTVVMLPKVVGNLKDYVFSMDARSYSTTTASVVYVGTMSDINDSTTYVPMDTFYMDGGNEFTHIEMELSKYNVVHDHIAITSGLAATLEKNSDIYIDNIRLGYPISCFAPKDVAISNPGLTSADLSFTPNSETDNKWEIELTKIGGGKQTFVTTQPSYSFENLDPASAYSVIVRTDCDGDYSDYTDAITFNTKWQIDTYKWTFTQNEQGTVSVPHKKGAAVATYALHPALISTGSQATLDYSSNTTYLPYQIMNTTSLAYDADKRDFVAGGDTARAMRLYRYFSTSYAYGDSAAVILPYIVNPQGKQLSMDLRFGWAYASNHSTATLQDVVSSTYPKGILCIGTVDSLETNLNTYQEITRVYPHPLTASDTLHEASHYGWMHYVLPLDMNLAGKQLVLMAQSPVSSYICIDNLAVEMTGAEGSLTTPVITSVGAGDTYATVNWTGNAESYNIYVVDTTKWARANFDKHIPYIQDAPACVDTIKNVTGNSYKVTGLHAGGQTYAFYVEDAAKEGAAGALSNRAFATTVCEAIVVEGSYSYDFEPGTGYVMGTNPSKSNADGFTFQWPTSTTASDTVYKTPDCWNYGITYSSYDKTSTTYKSYNPTLRSNSMTAAAASQYRYARSGYSCMQFYGTSTYKEVYAVMPLMTGYDPDTMEINFWGRCTYEKVQGGTIYTTSYLKGTSYSTKMAVGTMTDPEDPSTFVALDTIEYDYTASDMTTSTVAANDPMGNNYWLNFTVPMAGATGSYIAFRQVGYGYFYMDDLTIRKRQTPRRPRDLKLLELGSTSATISWMGEEMAEGGQYIIQISNSPTNWDGVRNETTALDSYEITGLAVSTKYYVRVKQEGSIYGNTDFAHYLEFTTECLPLNPNGYSTGFECDNEIDPWVVIPGATGTNVNTLKQNQCWTYWAPRTNSTSVTTGYRPYNIVNTASYGYSHSGDYALKLYETVSTVQQAVVSPLIDAELGVPGVGFDTLQITFWACPSYHGLSGTNKDKIASAQGTAYAKYIEIGTCTDPTDTTTYTVLEGWTYQVEGNNLKTGMQADKNNDYAFQKVTVKLNNATGPYVFIRGNHLRDGQSFSSGSTMYIDDLKFEKLLNCEVPTNLRAEDVTTRNAQIRWEADALTYDIQVSKDPTFTDDEKLIADTDVDTAYFPVEGLEPATQYYVRVKAYCDAAKKDASDWTMTANFNTPYAPMYKEDFTMSLGEWRMCYGYANKVFAGKAAPRDTTLSSTYNRWDRVQNLALSGYAVRSLLGYAASANPSYPISSTYQAETYYQKYWLISPSITLEKDSARLAFLAALTNYTTADPITAHSHWNEGWDDQFMVIISEDDGKTWKRENAVVWNNETSNDPSDAHYKYGIGDYKLTDIPATPTQMYVDLKKYTGKTIRVAFYAENTDQNAMNAIHVDQIHINYAVTMQDAITLCQYEDVEDILGFSINGDTVSAGAMKLERSVLGNEDVKDSLFVLDVNYLEAPQYYYEMTVCAGHPFEYMGFNQHTKPGVYRMKLKSQVTGCDSIVNFVLRHAETFRTTIDTTICYGSSIEFNGQKYSEAGTYTATYQSSAYLGGCDSIVTLYLSLTDPIVTNVNKSICQGDEYDWAEADMTLTESGTYTHTFPAANGCDSVVNLTLTVHKPVYGYQEVSMPQGGSYNWDNNVYTTDGAYEKYGKSKVTGCDSITVLMLHIIPAPVDTTYYAYCEGSSYTFYGKQYSEVGVYRDTTYAEETHYMAIHELHLSRNPKKTNSLGTKYIKLGSSYDFYGKMISESGMYYDTVPSVETGCDSINYLNLIALAPVHSSMSMTVCSSELPIEWKGMTLNAAGAYHFDTLTVHETDSIIDLTLEVIQPTTATIKESFCEGGSFELNGKSYAVAGTYYDTLTSVATGCDSIITLVLTRNAAPVNVVYDVFCEGSSYDFGGKQLYVQGVYRDTVYAEGTHCMEITELHLSMNLIKRNDLGTKYIKLGSSYDFYGKMISESGMYYDTVPSVETGCDSINYLNLIALPPVHSSMSMTVCSSELPIEWKGMTLNEAGAYHFDTLTVHETDSIIDLTLDVIQPTTSTIKESFCEGGSFELNGKSYAVAGTYYDTLTSVATGCDSIITLVLTQTSAPVEKIAQSICAGESYSFGGKQLNAEGVYRDTVYAEGSHCMEITELTLTVNPILYNNFGTQYINLGETYPFYGKDLSESGIYYDTVSSVVTGCDSINFINLVVLTNFTGYESNTVCSSDMPIEWKGMKIEKAGTYKFDTLTIHETDSIVYLTLDVIQPTTATLRESFCEGGSYELNGKSYAVAGTYYDTLTSVATGCDSIITLVLTRNAAPVNVVYDVFCEGGSYDFSGKQLNAEGVYRDTVYAEGTHCMEITELHLSKNPIKRHSLGTAYIKSGSSYDFYGKMISESGMYYDTVLSVETGCDSINSIQLWALEPVHSRVTISVCPSELPIEWKGMTLNAAGAYHFDTLTVHETDSIIDLTLEVIQPTTSSINASFCEGGSYELNGETYSVGGTYYQTLTSVATGCDSIITLVLTQTPASVNVINDAFCEGSSYDFGGKQLNAPGVYRDTVYAEGTHCMEITELHLSKNPIKRHSLGTAYIKSGSSYDFYGKMISETGMYYDTVPSVETGCDSINSLYLDVREPVHSYVSKTVCSGALPIEWKGMTLNEAGAYKFDTLTVHETDSVIHLTLEVTQPVYGSVKESFCEGGSYVWNGKTYSAAGTYYETIPSLATGCDSIVTLVLTQTPAPVIPARAAICEGDSYMFGSKQLTAQGIYRDTTYAEGSHCMEITELTLAIIRPVTKNVVETICEGGSYTFGGKELTEAGDYVDTLTSVAGCDSIIVKLRLNVTTLTRKTIAKAICKGDSYQFGGKELTEAGIYYDTLRYSLGCDSIITELILSVNEPTTYDYNYVLCAGGTYDFFGKELSAEGDYSDTIPNAIGCDSIITVHITISEPLKGTKYAEYCGEAYIYEEGDGNEYTEGTHDVWLKTEAGCDSIVTLTLKQTFDVHDTLRVTMCAGEIFSDEHFTVEKPGTYFYEDTQMGGCTYYHVLYFDNYPTEMSIDTTVLVDDLPTLILAVPDEYKAYADSIIALISEPGDYKDSIEVQTPAGCDFTIFVTLHVKEAMSIRDIYEDENGQKVLKVLYRERLYIIRQDGWYNAAGQKVENPIR